MDTEELKQAKLVLESEAQSILAAKDRLSSSFIAALDLITDSLKKGGKVVTTGVGKSGKVASKVAATLSSTGTLAIYMHPGEAAHGDLGIMNSKDVILTFSYSGTSEELVFLLPSFKRLGVKTISIVGDLKSTLAQSSDIVLDASVTQEACPLNLAPTSSTTVAMAIGDAMALGLSRRWHFQQDQFAIIHPGGALGRRLTLLVQDLMQQGDALPWVGETAPMDEVVAATTSKHLGCVLVHNVQNQLVGLITDGDIRRSLQHKSRFFDLKAQDIMTKDPIAVAPDTKAIDALQIMENRSSQISVLPVVVTHSSGRKECVGLVRLHDLIGRLQTHHTPHT